jgi:plastocyanin
LGLEEAIEGYRPIHAIQQAEGSSDVRKGIRSMVAVLALGALGATLGWVQGASAKPAPPPAPATVKVVDAPDPSQPKGYEPAEVTVKVGQAVTWNNEGNEAHTVTADDKSFDSGSKAHGESWQNTFSKPGQFAYHCTPHPWMKGTVKVTP